MDTPPPPPDETTGALVAEARRLVAGLVAFVFNVLHAAPPGPLSAAQVRLFLRTVIKPGEALVRRAIYLLAANLAAPASRAASARTAAPPPRSPRAAPELRIPAFRLTEPTGQGRTSMTGKTLPPRTGAAPDLNLLSEKFLKRLAALQAACADPDKCALRLRRRVARKRPAHLPLAAAPPSGIIRSRADDMKSLYARLAHAATQCWPRLCDTS